MKMTPILMNADMVRATMAGTKTQTRRVVKPKRCHRLLPGQTFADNSLSAYPDGSGLGWLFHSIPPSPKGAEWTKKHYPGNQGINCPYGNVGDRLWVREAWHASVIADCGTALEYKATFKQFQEKNPEVPWEGFTSSVEAYEWTCIHYKPHWMPSIHMPRWASRLTLEITNVKAERLQNISEDDAEAEGIGGWEDRMPGGDDAQDYWTNYMATERDRKRYGYVDFAGDRIASFKSLWCATGGKKTWERNEWVWAISFKVVDDPQSPTKNLTSSS